MLVLYGGTGFIGRHICERASRHTTKVAVISRTPDTTFLSALGTDIASAVACTHKADDLLSRATTCVYLANTSKPSFTFQTVADVVTEDLKAVTTFTEKLLRLNANCKFIYLSSGGQIYGPSHTHPINETNIAHPTTPYALSKRLNENMLTFFKSLYGMNISIFRLANPIGHWQVGTSHGLVSAATVAAIKGTLLTIYGNGQNSRDYFDVDDFSNFIYKLHVHDKIPTGTFNIGSGQAMTERDVIASVKQALGLSLEVNFVQARNFDLPYAVLDVSKAHCELGWKSETSIEASIQKIATITQQKTADKISV